ncbi:MAG: hypothetical protein ABJL99_11420 [Aliishimia sp.]
MAIKGLTEEQEKFVRQYLGNSIFTRGSDKKKTKEYKAFLEAAAKVHEIIDRISDLTPNTRPILDVLTDAENKNEDGDFKTAAAGAATALAMAKDVETAIHAAQSKSRAILTLLNEKTATPDNATVEETAALEATRVEIRAHLAGIVPSVTGLQNAEQKIKALIQTDIPAVVAAVADREVRTKRKLELRTLLDTNTADPTGSSDTTKAHLEGLRDDIRGLLADAFPTTPDLGTAEQKLTTLIDTEIPAVVARIENARKDIIKQVAQAKPRLAEQVKRLPKLLGHDDYDDMKRLADEVIATLDTATQSEAAALEVDCLQAVTDLGGVPGKLDELEKQTGPALIAATKVLLKDSGVTDRQKDALASLAAGSVEAFDAAKKVLDDLKGDLGDLEVTPVVLDTKQKAIDDKSTLFLAKKEQCTEFLDQKKEAATKWKSAKAEHDTLTLEITAKTNDVNDFKTANSTILNDTAHPDHTRIKEDLAALELAEQQRTDRKQELDVELAAQRLAYETNAQALTVAAAAHNILLDEVRAARKEFEQATAKKKMVDAVSFGPLSATNGHAIDPAIAAELIPLYGKNAAIADKAVKSAATAKYPESVAKCATLVADQMDTGFAHGTDTWSNDKYCQAYSEQLIGVSGTCDAATIGKLDGYLASGRQHVTHDSFSTGTSKERTKARTDHVGTELMKRDGNGDLNLDGARDAVLDVLFNPSAAMSGTDTPVLANQMLETLDWLEQNPDAQDKVNNIGDPTGPAVGFLARATGKATNQVKKEDAQQAVLQAMMTPVYQGNVGSCFATAGVVRMRSTEPEKTLDTYVEMATTGIFTPTKGDPVPIVKNVGLDEDPLVRSLEYSAAAATARAVGSKQKATLESQAKKGAATFEQDIKPQLWPEVQQRIANAVQQGFTFTYDPTIKVALAGDGRSENGRHVLLEASNKNPVTDLASFIAAIENIIIATVRPEDCVATMTPQELVKTWEPAVFAETFKIKGKFPWELSSGGHTDEATATLFGGDVQTLPFLPEVDKDTVDVQARTEQVMQGFLDNFGGRGEDMITMRTVGQHGFSALPTHPSLEPLLKGNPPDFAANMRDALLTPGAAIADADLPLDRVLYMFEEDLQGFTRRDKDDKKKAIIAKVRAKAPTSALKPAAYKALVTQEFAKARAEVDADLWKAKQKADTGADPTPQQAAQYLDEQTEKHKKKSEQIAATRLVNDLDVPEFTIADTNWGSGGRHDFFVIAPDPATGKPQLYLKSDPPGTLIPQPKDNEWVAKSWARVE